MRLPETHIEISLNSSTGNLAIDSIQDEAELRKYSAALLLNSHVILSFSRSEPSGLLPSKPHISVLRHAVKHENAFWSRRGHHN